MEANHPPDIVALEAALDANERDARSLAADLTEESGTWRSEPGSWSVAECLDHLATGNRVYVHAMQGPAERAAAQKQVRRGPARPGLIGGWFVKTLEPPVTPMFKGKAPRLIRPRISPGLADAFGAFLASQNDVRRFLRRTAASIWPACDSRTPSSEASASASRQDCTSSRRTSGVISGRRGTCAGPRNAPRRSDAARSILATHPSVTINHEAHEDTKSTKHFVVFGSSWFFVFHP